MLTIRFNRVGKKNKAQFRIVVQEHTIAPGGRHVEIVGSWNPHQKEGSFNNERIKYWIDKGAQVSDSVHNLLVSREVIKGEKRTIKIKEKKKSEEDGSKKEENVKDSKEDKTEEKPKESEKKDEKQKDEEKDKAEDKKVSDKKEDK